MKLAREFYMRNPKTVAKELLGKIIVNKSDRSVLRARIVETEAYFGKKDPGSHAFRGMTPRNSIMYKIGGTVYTYFTYGNHWMLNVVTGKEGDPGAVLIRALEPLGGIDVMRRRRKRDKVENLCNGPGKLAQAFAIGKEHNGADITGGNLFIEDSNEKINIVTTTRVGLSKGGKLPLRFYVKGNLFVSKK
jgi:DNA-3-methyladenine glycosylase